MKLHYEVMVYDDQLDSQCLPDTEQWHDLTDIITNLDDDLQVVEYDSRASHIIRGPHLEYFSYMIVSGDRIVSLIAER